MKFDYDVAVFDMDGTLLDTMAYWRFTCLEYILHYGYPLRLDYVARMYKESSKKILSLYAEEMGIKLDIDDAYHELEGFMNRHYINDARTKPHVKEFLELLKSNGIRICVATATPKEFAMNAFNRTGVSEYFEFIVDNYETEYTKKSPDFFVKLAERLGVSPGRCMMFEDSLYAIKSAKAAGLQVCGVYDGAQDYDKEEIVRLSDMYIHDFSELIG